jgi:hypothetical protein
MEGVLRYSHDSPRVPNYGTLGSPVLPLSLKDSHVGSFGVIKLSSTRYYVKIYKEVIKIPRYHLLLAAWSLNFPLKQPLKLVIPPAFSSVESQRLATAACGKSA